MVVASQLEDSTPLSLKRALIQSGRHNLLRKEARKQRKRVQKTPDKMGIDLDMSGTITHLIQISAPNL